MPNAASLRLTRALLVVGLLVLVAAVGLRKVRAPDYWFHLNIGRWIAEQGTVPDADVFTYTAQGNPYLDIHWLFQLGLYGVQSMGGEAGVVVAKAFLIALIAALLATVGWRRDRPFVAALGIGLALVAANDRLLARPELTSFVLLAAILALLERDTRRADRGLFAILPLQLLWVNTHGLFALGIALCGIYTVGAAVRSRFGSGEAEEARRFRRLALLTGVLFLLSFATPSPIAGALYPLEQLGMITPSGENEGPKLAVGETAPLWETDLVAFTPVIIAGALALLALLLNLRTNERRIEHGLAFVAFLGLFLLANRNGALFVIVASPLAIRSANEWLDRRRFGGWVDGLGSGVTLALLLAVSWDLYRGSFYDRTHGYHEPGLGTVELFVAEGAADWIERERPQGRLAHSMIVGGYLSWRLYPDYEVMADGRLEVYGAKLLTRLALRNPGSFRRLDEQYGFGCVVLMSLFDSPALITWLQEQPGWLLVHADLASLVFVRADDPAAARAPEIDVHARGFLALPPLSRPIDERAYTNARQRLVGALRQAGR